jgi:molybdate transport system substrate-binding protein
MSTLNILSGGAAHGLVASLTPAFKAATGFDIAGEFGAVGLMADKLRSGTPAEVHIQTGDRSLLSYIFKPLKDQFARAFRDS